MGEMVPIPYGVQSYIARSGYAYGERLINWYAEAHPGGKGKATLYPTPGLKPWTTVGSGVIRGMHVMRNFLYVVVDTDCYRVSADKVAERVGYVTGSGRVRMTTDGTHVAVLTANEAYAINENGTNLLAEANLIGCAYQDGFTIFVQRNGQLIWVSDQDDMTTIGGLSFTSKDALPDDVADVVMDNRELIIYGQRSTEVLYNSGEGTVPFVRVPSGFVERGLYVSGAAIKTGRGTFWLGDDKRVYRFAQYQPQRVSTDGIENLIEQSSAPESCLASVYFQAGHEFVKFSFSDLTLFYDIDQGLWHERRSINRDRWIGEHHAQFATKSLVTNYQTNELYELDLETYTDDGEPIRRVCEFPIIDGGGHRYAFSRMLLDFEPGVGLESGQGVDPKAMLDWTNDGGKTYSNELWAPIGKLGEYGNRALFTRLGMDYQRRFRVAVSDPVKAVLVNATADVEKRL
jgi:hypothetical protein